MSTATAEQVFVSAEKQHAQTAQRVTVTNVGPGVVSVQQPPGAQGVPIKVGSSASLEVGPEGFKVVLG